MRVATPSLKGYYIAVEMVAAPIAKKFSISVEQVALCIVDSTRILRHITVGYYHLYYSNICSYSSRILSIVVTALIQSTST